MNANHTSGTVGGVQSLNKASFADLRGAMFCRCIRLVGAAGVEPIYLTGHFCSKIEALFAAILRQELQVV
jgi:hypothetical protein